MAVVVHLSDCFDMLPTLPDESVHAVVCDPPYGINFMGKAWDGAAIQEAAEKNRRDTSSLTRLTGSSDPGTARKEITRSASAFQNRAGEAGTYDFSTRGNLAFQQWCTQWGAECLRVLKPGGHLLSFGGTRTYHRLAAGLEDAGFEIRDCLAWMFGSGFPKSLNLGNGQGTALKPAFEPIVLARKPLVGTVAGNVLTHGTGALNVDGCRVDVTDVAYDRNWSGERGHAGTRELGQTGATSLRVGGGCRPLRVSGKTDTEGKNTYGSGGPGGGSRAVGDTTLGRWPANVVLDEDAAAMLDEQTGTLTSGSEPDSGFVRHEPGIREGVYGGGRGLWKEEQEAGSLYGDSGGASRFFYCAKVSRAERNAGCDGFDPRMMRWSSGDQSPGTFQSEGTDKTARNHHPTVKPVALMRWLVRLVTPLGGTILDPFTGSGSTGIAAALEGFDFIGIEREADYHRIAEARIAWWTEHGDRALDVARVAEREKPPEDQQSIYSELA